MVLSGVLNGAVLPIIPFLFLSLCAMMPAWAMDIDQQPITSVYDSANTCQDDIPASIHPPGHLRPLGSHRPSEHPGVDILEIVPHPQEFFSHYVKNSRPVVFRGAAKQMRSYRLWTDKFLSEHYGDLIVEVEEGKKENRSKDLWKMPLSKFIEGYQEEDMYLVTDVPVEMSDDVYLLRCVLCGGFTSSLMDTVIWYSSGGTKSVLHYDSADNINCVMDGRKELFLVDKREAASVTIDHPDGSFCGVDVDRVDLQKYPGLGHVPWYNVTLEKGDCLFIPYRWFHSVQSTGRNLAVNVWFVHQLWFNASDCLGNSADLPEYLPLSRIKTKAHKLEPLRSELAIEIDSSGGSLSLAQLKSMDVMARSEQDKTTELFELLDTDGDALLTMNEIYTDSFLEACKSIITYLHLENAEEGEGEIDIQLYTREINGKSETPRERTEGERDEL